MDIMPIEFNFIVVSLILVSAIIFLYSRFVIQNHFIRNTNEGFTVIDTIKTLKKSCPVQFSNKWKLVSSSFSSTRCYYKNVLFPGFKSCIKIYGATCAVTCSSLYAFSLISDVCKWGEWEPFQSTSQNLLLCPFNANELKKDHFMQADQIAGIHRGTNIQSCIAMYRFLCPPTKSTKWILFWNAKKFEFMFFLIQPVLNDEDQCVITHLFASDSLSHRCPELVSQRILNIKEFLVLSQVKVKPLSSTVTRVSTTLKSKFTDKEKAKLSFEKSNTFDTSDSVFFLIPVFHLFGFSFKQLKGYKLIMKKVFIKSHSQKLKREINLIQKPNIREPLRRTRSDFTIATKTIKDFNCSSEVTNIYKDTAVELKVFNDVDKTSEDEVSKATEVFETNCDSKGMEDSQFQPQVSRLKLRSLSEPSVVNVEKSKSLIEMPSDEDNMKSLHSISELEESIEKVDPDKHEIICSSTSDFEMIDSSNQRFLDTTLADYFTQGNYGASVLQTEMMLASQFDKSMSTGNRVAGGWIHTSTYRGVPVLTKSIAGKIMKISSFLCQIEMPVNCEDVWICVKNPRFRFIWDETVKIVKILDKISDSQKLIHTYHETTGVLKKETVDFCLLQTEREEKNNFYSVFQSVEYEKCPLLQSATRGNLKPSGWVVQNISPNKCKVTYLIQIFVNSSDSLFIQELSSLVPQSLHNLKQYLVSKPK